MTDDPNPLTARVPVPVEATIQPAVAVDPSPLLLPGVAPGESITRPLIVHGKMPFHIVRADCGDKRFQCTPPSAENTLHRLPVTFTAGAEAKAGRTSTVVRIATDVPGQPTLEVVVSVDIAPVAGAKQPANPPKPAPQKVPEKEP